jgi:methionine-gamma-lyase
MKDQKSFGSLCIHDAALPEIIRSTQLPIYPSSSFSFDSIEEGMETFRGDRAQHLYSRFGNPTTDLVGQKIASLETFGSDIEAYGFMTSSGMSAISTLVAGLLKSGDKILTQGNLYGGTTELFLRTFKDLGIETILVDLRQPALVEAALQADSSIKMLYFETPSNPTMDCLDIEALCAIAKKYQVVSAVDNTFCTPYLQRPLLLGADYVIHSTTKYLNGHGNSIAGVIIGTNISDMKTKVLKTMKLLGTNCSPFEAWLTNTGMKTLELRMERHCDNAEAIAAYLEQHPKVLKVNYNGLSSHPDHALAKRQMKRFGGMLSFELNGGLETGIKFMNAVQFCTLAPTLGDTETLILHPASMSHLNVAKEIRLQNGITDGLIRLSVGIEPVADIIADLEQALAQL